MKKLLLQKISLALVLALGVTACTKDLDRSPLYEPNPENVYSDFNNYISVLAKLYAGFAISGQQGPAGNGDIGGIDEGFSNYLRQFWMAEELPTDEAVIAWNDGTLQEYHKMIWTANNEFVGAMYDRIFYQISQANEFIRQMSDDNLSKRGISGSQADAAHQYKEEARFIRALCYYHALDLYGNVPFVTESNLVGGPLPQQISRADLFSYIENELLDISDHIMTANSNEYGRADQAAVWSLLAKLYLNAQVYIGTAKYTECITYCNKVIGAGYSLQPQYSNLFRSDNNGSPEMIFPINFDGLHTQGYGGMTFLIHASVGGSMNPADYGINGGWYGLRTTKEFVGLFPDISGATDTRALFYTNGQSIEINDLGIFTDGYAIGKYKNLTSNGIKGSDPTGNFPDTDYPMFRLADIYLMYAEAVLRGGNGGDESTALGYVNAIRNRAYGGNSGEISADQLTTDFILAERGRELQWEGTRRTDLIRYGLFTGDSYKWAWKGGVKDGVAVEDYRNLMPIPNSDLVANPNLVQNPGY